MLNKTKLIDEFTMASVEHSLAYILAIRAVEQISSRPALKRLYYDYQKASQAEASFWQALMAQLKIDINFHGTHPEAVPKSNPLVIVANHPYGVLDGLAICWLIAQQRSDFKIMINHVMCRFPEMENYVLPINFNHTPKALKTNLASRKAAGKYLENGGAVIIFPAGKIARTETFLKKTAIDAEWGSLVGKLVRKTHANVLPIYFGGQNSQLFQKTSHISHTARWGMLFHEVHRRRGTSLDMVVGDLLAYADIEATLPPKQLAAFLREHTHALSRLIGTGD